MMASGVPGKKILLGIPLFGRSFLNVSGPGHKNRGCGGEDGSFEYNTLPRRGTKEHVDKKACAAQCVGGDGGFVSYDNPETVRMKATFCKQKGLGVRQLPISRSTATDTFECRDSRTGVRHLTPKTARGA